MYHYFKHKGHSVTGLARTESKYTDIIFDTFSKENLLQLFALIDKKHPYIIINCIGCLVQESNNNPEQAIYLNSYFPHLLEMMTKGTKNKVIHLSTDCIFSGIELESVLTDNLGYWEYSLPNERNYYGRSKALGELNNTKDLTLRQSIIGPAPQASNNGLLNWILKETSSEVKGWSSTFWNGITTLELAKQIEAILLVSPQLSGIVHLVPPAVISKCALIELIIKEWNLSLKVNETSSPFTYKVLKVSRKDVPILKSDYDKQLKELHMYMDKYNIKPGNLT